MPETFALSGSAVGVLRFRVKGYRMKVTNSLLAAFRELAAAAIMEPVPGADGNAEADYQFTEDGWARRQELLSEAEERIDRERFEPPDASNLSEAATELLRRRLAGDREVTDANRPLYRELVAARILYRSRRGWAVRSRCFDLPARAGSAGRNGWRADHAQVCGGRNRRCGGRDRAIRIPLASRAQYDASRREPLCRPLHCPKLLSPSFASASRAGDSSFG